jgi:hypothetical protein
MRRSKRAHMWRNRHEKTRSKAGYVFNRVRLTARDTEHRDLNRRVIECIIERGQKLNR